MLTPGVEEMLKGMAPQLGLSADDMHRAVRREALLAQPRARLGRPEDIAFAVAFLVSPLAGYINGTNLRVDGETYHGQLVRPTGGTRCAASGRGGRLVGLKGSPSGHRDSDRPPVPWPRGRQPSRTGIRQRPGNCWPSVSWLGSTGSRRGRGPRTACSRRGPVFRGSSPLRRMTSLQVHRWRPGRPPTADLGHGHDGCRRR